MTTVRLNVSDELEVERLAKEAGFENAGDYLEALVWADRRTATEARQIVAMRTAVRRPNALSHMKQYYSCRFGHLQSATHAWEQLSNPQWDLYEIYANIGTRVKTTTREEPACESHPLATGQSIVSILADGSSLDVRSDVVAIGGNAVAFSKDALRDDRFASLSVGPMADVTWTERGDDRSFVTPSCSRDTMQARPPLDEHDDALCIHCGSNRVFCPTCLGFLASCTECSREIKTSELYDAIDISRRRRGEGPAVRYHECILLSEFNMDIASSALKRRPGNCPIYYSEEFLDFILSNLRCNVAVTKMPSILESDYRELLLSINAI